MTVAQMLEREAQRRHDTTMSATAFPPDRRISSLELDEMRQELRKSTAENATARALAGTDTGWVCAI